MRRHRLRAAVWVALLIGAATAAHAQDGADATASLVGRRVDDFVVAALDGRRLRLSEIRGDGPVFIQFFASYCKICREEVPVLNDAHRRLKDQGMPVIGITFREGPEGAADFKRKLSEPAAYPFYVDADGAAEKALFVQAVPLNVLIDADGVVRYYDVQLPEDTAEVLSRFLATGQLEPPRGAMARVSAAFKRLLAARSVWVFPIAFVGGVLSVLLPCVYPVIPVAAGFFGSQASGSRGRAFVLALAYGLGMALLVTALGLIALSVGTSVGEIAANRWVNLGVGLAIILFSLPVLGVVHLRTPGALGRAQGKAAAMRGAPAAFILGVVSGPIVSVCVAPILGAILLAVTVGGVGLVRGTILLLLYGLGLATPFIILGTFTGLLKSLPKPGGWMRWVQVAFGVLLALVGLYFALVRGILHRL